MIDEIPAHPVCSELDSLPTLDELLRRLNAGKVGGKTGILLELLKYGVTKPATTPDAGYGSKALWSVTGGMP